MSYPSNQMSKHHTSDFLVLGSGIAGLTFALKAATLGSVTIITKKERAESNTNYAQGGIAAVMEETDTTEGHLHDTLIAGAGLCNRNVVEVLVNEGPERIHELIAMGTQFTRKADGSLDLGREGGHSRNRIVHAADLTGREVERALLQAVADNPQITLLEHFTAVELITEHHIPGARTMGVRHRNCYGVYALNNRSGNIEMFLARRILLATGGCGQVYLHTTNPAIATADGYAMAYRAGAVLANMEFVQFHPTSLYAPERKGGTFLITEAVRGHGGILRTRSGERFMPRYDHRAELAPRDIVARAIDAELKRSGDPSVLLDVTHIPYDDFQQHFPNIEAECARLGIDVRTMPIPVVPAAHYQCGGVRTDLWGRTSINRLYACGEVSCTGVHGANRLASNSLLEALVFSHRAFNKIQEEWCGGEMAYPEIARWNDRGMFNIEEWIVVEHDRREIQQIMWDLVGIVRSNARLVRAARRARLIRDEIEEYFRRTKITVELIELRNIAETALLIVEAALTRKESRGLHFTTDYPETDDPLWLRDTLIEKAVL